MRGWTAALKAALLTACGEWHYGRWLRWRHFTRLVPHLPCDLEAADILDAGCGEGTAALWLAARYPGCRVTGIDVDAADIASCRREAAARELPNVHFEVGRIENLRDHQRYHFAYTIAVLEYIDRDGEAVARLKQALRPGGVLLIEVRDRGIGVSPTFGLRRLAADHDHNDEAGYARRGYTLAALHRLLESNGLRVQGARHAIAPPAAFAHTIFERLRARRLRWYFVLLPALRAVGYTDFVWRWRRGGSLVHLHNKEWDG